MIRTVTVAALALALAPSLAVAQPTHANLEYAPADPATSNGHKLDLYIPAATSGPLPVVIWTSGSAWMADTGKGRAGAMAAQLMPAGYAVAGVSIRSSSQVKFPGQLHDIKAAIRWLRENAAKYNLNPDRDRDHGRQLRRMDVRDGGADRRLARAGRGGGYDRGVQRRAGGRGLLPADRLPDDGRVGAGKCEAAHCHDTRAPRVAPGRLRHSELSREGAGGQSVRYVTAADPPVMILHGGSDPLVPHHQGEQLYMALNKACRDGVFISLPKPRATAPGTASSPTMDARGGNDAPGRAGGCAVTRPRRSCPRGRR